MSTTPHVSIIILHWKHLSDTRHCIKSVEQLTYPSYDVYLVLNGASHDDVISIHNLYDTKQQFHIIDLDENTGFAEGNNIGIREAMKTSNLDYILTLNNDTEITPHALDEAVHKASEGYDMVQLLQMNFEQRNTIDTAGIRLGLSLLPFNITQDLESHSMVCPSAGAALYSTALLQSVALKRQHSHGFSNTIELEYFDSDFFAYAEDLDLGLRARSLGMEAALADRAIVYHRGSASTAPMSDFAIYHTYRNLIWVYTKNAPRRWRFTFGLFFIIGQLAILIKNLRRGQQAHIIQAWRDAKADMATMQAKRTVIQKKATHALPTALIEKTLF